jgi:uncharacterized metal-binding protein
MAGCSCGCGSDCGEGDGKKRIIFACAGASNVGQITNIAAIQLSVEGYGSLACTAQLATGAGPVKKKCTEADEVVVLNGCPVACTSKIVEAQGIVPDQVIIATEQGIAKTHDLDISEEDIEKVVCAAWEGNGKAKRYRDHPEGGCGCGCGGE